MIRVVKIYRIRLHPFHLCLYHFASHHFAFTPSFPFQPDEALRESVYNLLVGFLC